MTYAPKVSPEEAEIKWEKDAISLHNQIRAFNPRPGAWCWVEWNGEKKRLKILRAKVHTADTRSNKDLIVDCGRGSLCLLEVQMEGKPRMQAADWLRGAKIPPKFLN